MARQLRNKMFSLLLALTLAAMATTTVFADGDLPPVTPEVPVVTEDGGLPPVEEVPVAAAEEEAVPPAATTVPSAPVVEKDPIWCPSGVAPKPMTGGCSPSFPDLSSLVAGGTPLTNGTIWIESGTDGGAEVVIDGASNWAAGKNYSLTLQGGWNGVSGSKVITGVTIFDTAISILNWNGAVAINHIVMNGASNTSFPTTGALVVQTTKNIVLSNVTAMNTNHSTTAGIYLTNTASATQATIMLKNVTLNHNLSGNGLSAWSDGAITLTNVSTNGNKGTVYLDNTSDTAASAVTVNTSSFNGSTTDSGLAIFSNGAIKLNQVTASKNNQRGVYADNSLATSAQPVTVTGFLTVSQNTSNSGASIFSNGAVTLTNLTANSNGGTGVYVNNTTAVKPQNVTITGTNVFANNTSAGLYVFSDGTISASNLSAFSNHAGGVYLDNSTGSKAGVTLSGVNLFNSNTGGNGLLIYSTGAIKASSLTANQNSGDGVALDNSTAATPQNVTITGVNAFNDNAGFGLFVASKGAISASNLSAFSNGFSGAFLDNLTGSKVGVTVSGVNSFDSNSTDGLTVLSTGAITVSNVSAVTNSGYGAYLYNAAVGAQSPVTILGYGTFIGNAFDGLYVLSHGAVTAKNLTANQNAGNGVLINTAGVSAPQKVTLSGYNTFIGNGNAASESGLVVNADGAITVSNITASYNYSSGAELNNYTNWFNHPNAPASFTTFGSVMLTGYGVFSNNVNGRGLYVLSNGSASLSNVSASYNYSDGVGLDVHGKVTLMCVTANNNKYGIWMYTQTPLLTIKGLIAIGNTVTDEHLYYATMTRTNCP